MIRPLGVSEFSDWQTKLLLPQPIGMSEPFNPKGFPLRVRILPARRNVFGLNPLGVSESLPLTGNILIRSYPLACQKV